MHISNFEAVIDTYISFFPASYGVSFVNILWKLTVL